MTIPLSVIGSALSIVDKLIGGGNDNKSYSGSPNDPKAPSGFKDAMKLASLAKVVGDKLSNVDKVKLEQLVNDKDIQKATELLQSLVSQLFGGNQAAAATATTDAGTIAAATPTLATATPVPTTPAQPTGLQLTARDVLHTRGVTTLGTPGALGPTYNADGTPIDLSPYMQEGMQATTPQQTPVNPQQTPAAPVAVAAPVPTPPLVSTAVTAPALTADVPLEAIPEAKSETSATAGIKGLVADPQNALASMQASSSGGGGANTGSSDQETFFMLNQLKREMKAPVEALEAPPDLARNLPPGLTYEAPRGFGVAQIEGALQPNIDTQKLIDKIMDGVFRPPVQLPKVVTLDLNPAHLGKLQVQVSMHDDGVRVQMTTANPLVKAALEQGMQDLKTAMNNSGLQLGHLDVNVKQDNQSRSFAQHHQQHQGRGSGRLRSLGFGSDDALDGVSSALGRAAPVRAAMAALSAVNAFA